MSSIAGKKNRKRVIEVPVEEESEYESEGDLVNSDGEDFENIEEELLVP